MRNKHSSQGSECWVVLKISEVARELFSAIYFESGTNAEVVDIVMGNIVGM